MYEPTLRWSENPFSHADPGMKRTSLYRRIISDEGGLWAWPALGLLRAAECVYACGVALRAAHYDRRGPRAVLPVPVISVGNLTVGGTGKTPFVIELVKRLERMGYSPAVLSRGYKAGIGEPGDEERLIRANCPSVVCLCEPDRARAGEIACQTFGADVVVLDDGFQHRRLGRTLDIVLIDATCPFGFGHLLPRGLLREPVRSLRRADVVVLTRCDQVSLAALARTEARLRDLACEAAHIKCRHRVTSVERLDGTPTGRDLAGARAIMFAGIGQPRAFATTVRSLGVEVVGEHWWPDHHAYRPRDIDALRRPGRFPLHDLLITTQKDAVKLDALENIDRTGIVVIKVAIDFMGEGDTILQSVMNTALQRH